MKIPISAKIPRSYGPPPLQKGAIGGFLGVDPDHCGSFSCAVLYRLVHELLWSGFRSLRNSRPGKFLELL